MDLIWFCQLVVGVVCVAANITSPRCHHCPDTLLVPPQTTPYRIEGQNGDETKSKLQMAVKETPQFLISTRFKTWQKQRYTLLTVTLPRNLFEIYN